MNKRKRTGRIALALLISGIVFLTNTIAMLLTIVAIYGLARLRVIETTGGQVGSSFTPVWLLDFFSPL